MEESTHPARVSTIETFRSNVWLTGKLMLMLVTGIRGADAAMFPDSPEIRKYLVIATGEAESGDEFESFNMSDVEIGADQELVSNSSVGSPSQRVGGTNGYNGGLDLTGTWVPNDGANAAPSGNRFDDIDFDHGSDVVGIPDVLRRARPVYEGIDYSGNVALTGARATFNSSNSDVNADIGIQVNRTPAAAFPSPSSNNSYFAPDGDPIDPADIGYNPFNDIQLDLNTLAGVSQFDPANLIGELETTRDFIVGLPSDTVFTSNIENTNIKDSGSPFTFNLDLDDANNDGFAVYDIDRDGSEFKINNSDVILQSTEGTIAIFRMADGKQFDFSNSSILLGDGELDSTDVIDELGAIFFMDAFKGTNELFNNNNVILGGIGLWDFTDFNPDRETLLYDGAVSLFDPAIGDATVVNLQDAQGCAQFISHQVLMSNNRWTHCAHGLTDLPPDDPGPTPGQETVPEPGTSLLVGLALVGWFFARRPRQNR